MDHTRGLVPPVNAPLRLNLGSGPGKREGFLSVDAIAFPQVDVITDLTGPWPWKDNSVSEVFSSHCIEHFTAKQRVHFVNELYRVLAPGVRDAAGKPVSGFATIIAPHWASCRAYGDPTHQWPPVSEFWFFYLRRDWRLANAPHTDVAHWAEGFNCNFDVGWGYSLDPGTASRNQEYQQFAMQYYTEARQDIQATFLKA